MFKIPDHASNLEMAASALGLELGQIGRIEFYRADGEPVMAIVPGDRRVDPDKLKAVCDCAELKNVAPDELTSITGYRPGVVPPVGLKSEMPVYIDYYALREDVLYTGSGEPASILKIRSYDLVRATGGEVVDLVDAESPDQDK